MSTPQTQQSCTLYLEGSSTGVFLKVREEEGREWYILKIANDGKLRRNCAVPTNLGLAIDVDGLIELDE